MEWDLKMPSWDFADMEQNAEQGMVPVVAGPSSWPSNQDCSVDLKLGGLGDFGQADRWKVQPRVPAAPSVAAASSSKRCRTLNNAGQIACCLVDGCKSDLSKCRDYHRRHKVCEVHSKTQIVMVGGQEQRFCQQCSRFHLLVEFDEVKRSCRKRLDGHNRRRRKPQPDPLDTANLFTNHQGIRFTPYPPLFPSNTPGGSAWPGIMKTEQDTMFTNQQSSSFISSRQQNLPSSFYINFKEGKKFPFLQDSETALGHRISLEASGKTIPSSQCSSMKMLPDGINHILDSEGALSLLSSPIQTAAINLSHMVHSDRIPVGQPLVSSLTYSGLGHYSGSQASSSVSPTGFSCSGMDDDHEGNILVSDASDADLPCHGIFPVGGEGSSDGASQALPFWL